MQVNYVTTDQLADLLEESKILDTLDYQGQRTYVLQWGKQDILAIDAPSGGALVVYPCSQLDEECGGSVHDHARLSE
jgi:hypothetical protein